MMRLATLVGGVLGALTFAQWVSLDRLAAVVQPIIVAISIMAAGLLVRLNRGMPTLDWKSLEPAKRKVLTLRVVEVTREYLFVLFIQAVTLVFLIALVAAAKQPPLIDGPLFDTVA
jgi:hypothetical protein